MRIRPRDKKGVNAGIGHRLSEGSEAGRAVIRTGRGGEALEHEVAFQLARRIRARFRFSGSASNNAANCSVMAPASCSTSVIVTACS